MKNFDNIKLKVCEFVKERAKKNWETYLIKEEWLWAILLTLLFKLLTNAVSIFSGYYYAESIIFGLIGSPTAARIIAVFALVLIEGLNALFLSKCFKFLLRLDLKCIFPAVLSMALFTLSFYISCNGIAMYKADKVDLTENIKQKYNQQRQTVENEFKAAQQHTEEQINTIKANPSEWMNGKRCALSNAQQLEINSCYDHLSQLTNDKQKRLAAVDAAESQELDANRATKDGEGSKYYKIVAIIMLIQIACNFLLMWFWHKIYNEEEEASAKKEIINKSVNEVSNVVESCLNEKVTQKVNLWRSVLAAIELDGRTPDTQKKTETVKKAAGFSLPETLETPPQIAAKNGGTPDKQNGHENGNTEAVPPSERTPERVEFSDVSGVQTEQKKCEFCGVILTPSQIAHGARFCCAQHRKLNWEQTTGKKLGVKDQDLK